MESYLNAVSILFSVVFGVLLYYVRLEFLGIVFVLATPFLVGALFYKLSLDQVHDNPVGAVRLSKYGVLLPIAVLAGLGWITALLADYIPCWLTLLGDRWIDTTRVNTDAGDITKVLLGALSTFLGATVLRDADQHDSRFWPSGVIKKAFVKKFTPLPDTVDAKTGNGALVNRLEQAVLMDNSLDESFKGWSLTALEKRAAVVQEGLDALKVVGAATPQRDRK